MNPFVDVNPFFFEEDEEIRPAGNPGALDQPGEDLLQHQRQLHPTPSITLPPFWPENAAAWFAMAESRFRVRRVFDEWDRYDNLISALNADSIRLVLDVVTNPPAEDPYTFLRDRLLGTHLQTNYQRIERLIAIGPLGDRKPSQLLAQMLEICPVGEHRSQFFAFHFLQRLPQELRIMLGDDDHQEIQQLAAKADRLWALHGHRLYGDVAAVAATMDPHQQINAVSSGRGSRGRGRGRGRGGPPSRGGGAAPAAKAVAPAALARESSGLCFYHWNFGEKAEKCEATCSWQGN